MDPHSLTIFFPCYNDAGMIADLVATADEVAKEFTADYEIIVVDDGSEDKSREILRKLRTQYPRLRLVFHEKNQGYGAALQSGFRSATKDWVFYTDGDGQYDIKEARSFFGLLQNGVSLVNGYKISRHDPWPRVLTGNLYRGLMRLFFKCPVRDVNCDFRLIRRDVFDAIQLHHTSGAICMELVKKLEWAGFHSVDYPVHHYPRRYGKSQFFRPKPIWQTSVDLFRLWWELRK